MPTLGDLLLGRQSGGLELFGHVGDFVQTPAGGVFLAQHLDPILQVLAVGLHQPGGGFPALQGFLDQPVGIPAGQRV